MARKNQFDERAQLVKECKQAKHDFDNATDADAQNRALGRKHATDAALAAFDAEKGADSDG